VLLGLIGFVIYPAIPKRYMDSWPLFNPGDAWMSVIAIAAIGFINYVLLRMYGTRPFLGPIFGGLVNSSATVAELGARAVKTGMVAQTTSDHDRDVCQESDSRDALLTSFSGRYPYAAPRHDPDRRSMGAPGHAS
jgi:hypothetical protein